jgi:hypothetical protein
MSSEKPSETVPERDDPIELTGEYMTKAIRYPRETADRFAEGLLRSCPANAIRSLPRPAARKAPRNVVGGASYHDRMDGRRRCPVSNIDKPEKENPHGSASSH